MAAIELTEQTRALLAMVYRPGATRFSDMSVAAARHSLEKMVFAFGFPEQAVDSVVDVPLARAGAPVLLARCYRPRHAGADALPAVVFCHGGGWCTGDVAVYDGYCRALANASRCAVVSVDYRLAPEHPFPAAADDALDAFVAVQALATTLDLDADRLALAGDSAGATLSITTALTCRERGLPMPRAMALVYPCTDVTGDWVSRVRYGEGFMLDQSSLTWFFDRYLAGVSLDDWRVSPLRAQSLAGLPPMWVTTAQCDPLTDEAQAFATCAHDAGVAVCHREVPGVVHGFALLGKMFPEARETMSELGAWLNARLNEGS